MECSRHDIVVGKGVAITTVAVLVAFLGSCSVPVKVASRPAMWRSDPARTGVVHSRAPGKAPKLKWRFGVPTPLTEYDGEIYSSPAVYNGAVFFAAFYGKVLSVDISTGRVKWEASIGETGSSPAAADGRVFIGSGDGNVYAFDSETGKEVWRFDTGPWGANSSPAVHDDVVYIGGGSGDKRYFGQAETGNVFALDAKTGKQKWKFKVIGAIQGASPAVAGGLVFFGDPQGYMRALDKETGKERWQFYAGGTISGAPAVAGGTVYFGTDGGPYFFALGAGTGELRWRFAAGKGQVSSAAVAEGLVYFSGTDALHALDVRTGREIWRSKIRGGSPVIAGSSLILTVSEDKASGIYALNAADGRVRWKARLRTFGSDSPAVADGVVYATGVWYVYALR